MNLRWTVGQGRTVQFIFLLSRHVQILQGSLSGIHVSMCCMEKTPTECEKEIQCSGHWYVGMEGWEGVRVSNIKLENQKIYEDSSMKGWLLCYK